MNDAIQDATRLISVFQESVNYAFTCKSLEFVSLREDFLIFFIINCYLGRILILIFIWLQAKCLHLDSNFIANNLRKKMGLRHFFTYKIGLHLGRHLGYIEMLNDARVASLGFFKDNACTTRINKEKKV